MDWVLGIDPGDKQSAVVLYSDGVVDEHHKAPNDWVRSYLRNVSVHQVVIEYTPPYTLPGGAKGKGFVPNQIPLTAIEIGRFIEICHIGGKGWELLSRTDIKKHMLGRATGTDADIRQAIMDRYGGTRDAAVGTVKEPGPLHGIKNDEWQALAVAIAWCELKELAK